MVQLSVNLNKLATLRNARGKNNPDVISWGERILKIEDSGFQVVGLTVHPRPDGRHIRHADVVELRTLLDKTLRTNGQKFELNIEGYPSRPFLDLVAAVRADQCTLVPDPPDAITSNAGWDFAKNFETLRQVTQNLREQRIRSSLFLDPMTFSHEQLLALKSISPDRVELYTETFADDFDKNPAAPQSLPIFRSVAEKLRNLGFGINAGHDLNQHNLGTLVKEIPWLKEVSIGHALICDSLEVGLEQTVKNYLQVLTEGQRRQ